MKKDLIPRPETGLWPSIRAISALQKSTTSWVDAAKAREKLGWRPRTTFEELVAEMVREELEIAKLEKSDKRQKSAYSIT